MNIINSIALIALLLLATCALVRTKGSWFPVVKRARFACGQLVLSLQPPRGEVFALANFTGDTHEQSKRFLADAVIATRYLLGKKGTDTDHIDICGAAEEPIVVIVDEATAAEKEVTGEFLSTSARTVPMIGSEVIAADVDVFTAANGQTQDLPAGAGTVWKVGRSVTACAGAGGKYEVIPCAPIRVVSIAALTAPTTAAGADAATTQALANAIKADLTAIDTALTTPGLLRIV